MSAQTTIHMSEQATNIHVSGISSLFTMLPFESMKAAVFMFGLINAAIILTVAWYVCEDASRRQRENAPVFLLPEWMWFLVTLATGGYLGAFAYWLIHYSALRKED